MCSVFMKYTCRVLSLTWRVTVTSRPLPPLHHLASMGQNAPPPSTYHKIGMLLKKRPDLLVQTDDEGLSAVLRGDTAFIKVLESVLFYIPFSL